MEKPSIWEIANNPNQPVIGPGIIGTKLATIPVIIKIIESIEIAFWASFISIILSIPLAYYLSLIHISEPTRPY